MLENNLIERRASPGMQARVEYFVMKEKSVPRILEQKLSISTKITLKELIARGRSRSFRYIQGRQIGRMS